ncbi:glycoside hydrolase family 15 protein [Nonomuraea angiospora]|uniref:glycoside hydrolase family 15 protein n=1 Tax=Nonomuraea angiospora TaxID=46172 RepID=UPI0037933D89
MAADARRPPPRRRAAAARDPRRRPRRRPAQPAALRWFERNRAACGPAGLLSEEYDVTQRQLRGNLPQAFVHALLLECAARLNE